MKNIVTPIYFIFCFLLSCQTLNKVVQDKQNIFSQYVSIQILENPIIVQDINNTIPNFFKDSEKNNIFVELIFKRFDTIKHIKDLNHNIANKFDIDSSYYNYIKMNRIESNIAINKALVILKKNQYNKLKELYPDTRFIIEINSAYTNKLQQELFAERILLDTKRNRKKLKKMKFYQVHRDIQ